MKIALLLGGLTHCAALLIAQTPTASDVLNTATWYEALDDGSLFSQPSQLPTATGHLGDDHGALRFDQVQLASVSNDFSIATLAEWTLSVWVKKDGAFSESVLLGRSEGSGSLNKWWLGYGWNNHVGFVLHTNRNSPASPYQGFGYNSVEFQPEQGTWSHVVCRFKDGLITLFVNGIASDSHSLAYPIPIPESTFVLGGTFNDSPGATGLILDDVAIWSRGLTGNEIQALWTSNSEGCTDPNACNFQTGALTDNGSCIYSSGVVSELPEWIEQGQTISLVADNSLQNEQVEPLGLNGLTYRDDFRGNHVYYSTDALIWSEAENTCNEGNGHIASIADAEENAFFRSLSNDYMHLGLTDNQTEGSWVWSDGTPFNYSNWNGGEPNNSGGGCRPLGEDYAAMYTSGKWNDDLEYYCGDVRPRHFACEIPFSYQTSWEFSNSWSNGVTGDSIAVLLDQDTVITLTTSSELGSCTFDIPININVIEGCTSPTACNYDPIAVQDDGTCIEYQGIAHPLSVSGDSISICLGEEVVLDAAFASNGGDPSSTLLMSFDLSCTSANSYTTPVLEDGQIYHITAVGRWGYADGWAHRDPAYDYIWDLDTQTKVNCDGTQDALPTVGWFFDEIYDFQRPINDQDNNSAFCEGVDKTYVWEILGDGATHTISYVDLGGYGDNSGAMHFEIFEVDEVPDVVTVLWDSTEEGLYYTFSPTTSTWLNSSVLIEGIATTCTDSLWVDVVASGCNVPTACNYNASDACDIDCVYPLFDGDCNAGGAACGPGTSWNASLQICQGDVPAYLNEPGGPAQLNPCYFDTDESGTVNVTDLMNILSVFGLDCSN